MTKRFWLSTVPFVVMAVAPARADLVSVTGGFTSFSGVVIGNAGPSFINGTQICPDTGCDTVFGTGSTTFSAPVGTVDFYTTPFPGGPGNTLNELSFIPADPQNVPGPGSNFTLGTLVFENGVWSGDAEFGFRLVSHSLNPALNDHVLEATVEMRLTPNLSTNTARQNADFLEFLDPVTGRALVDPLTGNPLDTVRVDELADGPNIGTVQLTGEIGSLLLTGFTDPTGGLFLDPSHDLAPSGAVPEPSSVLLLGTAVAVLGGCVRRRNKFGVTADVNRIV